MKVKNNISYPYPIWGWKDDYKTIIPDEDIQITEIQDKDYFIYELELLAHNSDIDNLISSQKAVYACDAFCPYTYYHHFFKSSEAKFTIKIPRKEVNHKVELKWMIISTESIPDFKSETLNDDYQGSVYFPLGAMLGYITSFEINPTICDELRSLDEIFVVVKNTESDEIKFSFEERKIKIKLPQEELDIFNNHGAKYPAIMHSTIVLQALVMGIYNLKKYEDDLDWVYILKQYIDTINSDDIPNFNETGDEGYTLEQCLEIANYILESPMKRMFKDIKIAEDQTTN